MAPRVILYHYDSSPFATKIKHILLLKQIPHDRVEVGAVLPRPALSRLLGITYRRIPILAIGNDVYCDTSLIASVLERRFPPSQGYASLFPPRKGGGKSDTALTKAFTMFYVDRTVFPLAANSLPWDKFPPAFIKDRSAWVGQDIDVNALAAAQSENKSTLSSHMQLLEEQLSDDKEWLINTESPSLADISLYMIYNWIRYFKTVKDLFDENKQPKLIRWLTRMSNYLAALEKKNPSLFRKISGDEAAKLIGSSAHEDYNVVGFDAVEAERLGLRHGDSAAISPTDTGKVPTVGKLVALNQEEAVIEVHGSTNDIIRVHFPRLGFTVRAASKVDAKL